MAYDLSRYKKEQERITKKPGGNFLEKFVNMPQGEGSITVRILPEPPGKDWFFAVTKLHRIKDRNYHTPKTLNRDTGRWEGYCPMDAWNKRCWKQSERQDITHAEKEAFIAEARSIAGRENYYYNVIVRSQTNRTTGEVEKNVGPLILPMGTKFHQWLIKKMVGNEMAGIDGLGYIPDLKDGFDIVIVKTIVGGFNNYDQTEIGKKCRAGTDAEIEKWMGSLHDLDSLITVKPMEELERMVRVFRGLEEDLPEGESGGHHEAEKPVVKEVVKPVAAPVKTQVVTEDDTDESLAEDEFLKNLRNSM